MLAIHRPSLRLYAGILTLAALVPLGGCGGGGGGGSSGSSSGGSGAGSSSGGTSPAPTVSVVTPANGKAFWGKGVSAQFALKDASGNAVTGALSCVSDDASTLTVAADCSSVTGKRVGQQTITVSGGGVSAKATIKVIPQPQPIGARGADSNSYYNLVVTPDGRVLAWGWNQYSVLGQGQSLAALDHLSLPAAVKDATGNVTLTGVVAVSAGAESVLALTEDGEVYSWGGNTNHQLGRTAVNGDGLPGKVIGPDGVTPLEHVVAISVGDGNAIALIDDGTVYSWGYFTGRSGSDPKVFAGPVDAVGGSGYLTGAVAISAGWNWSAALLADGRVVTWGYSFSAKGANFGQGAIIANTVASPGYVTSGSTGQPVNDAVSISAGYNFGLALSSAGTAYVWGEDDFGQTGQNTAYVNAYSAVSVKAPGGTGSLSGLSMVAAGGRYALALGSGGQVFSWGINHDGQLGDGVDTPRGQESHLPAPVVALGGINQLGNIAAIATGYGQSLALAGDGSLLIWGDGIKSNLGQGVTSDTDSFVPLAVKNESGTGALNLGPMTYWPNPTQRAR